jgi:hypothetical protein
LLTAGGPVPGCRVHATCTLRVGVITTGGLDRFFAEREEYLRSLTGPPDQHYILALNEKYGVFPA